MAGLGRSVSFPDEEVFEWRLDVMNYPGEVRDNSLNRETSIYEKSWKKYT